MDDDNNSENIEWEQDKGFSQKSRISRRIDTKQAEIADKKKPNNFSDSRIGTPLPPNLKRLQRKIKDVYDDDEDEEDGGIVFNLSPENDASSLLDALHDDEKNKLHAKTVIDNQKNQQAAGKMSATLMADKMSKKLGLKGLKKRSIQNNSLDASLNSLTFDKVLRNDIAAKTNLKTKNLSTKETVSLVKGLDKLKQVENKPDEVKPKLIEKMKADELIKLGQKQNENETAKLILEKSGRKADNKKKKKTVKEAAKERKPEIKKALKQVKER
jgi:hypothetical protein